MSETHLPSPNNPVGASRRVVLPLIIAGILVILACLSLGAFTLFRVAQSFLGRSALTPTETLTATPNLIITLPATWTATFTFTPEATLTPSLTPSETLAPLPTDTLQPIYTLTIPPTIRLVPVIPATTAVKIPCVCTSDKYSCANFKSFTDAQACFTYCKRLGYGDIHKLDKDGNGLACENLP